MVFWKVNFQRYQKLQGNHEDLKNVTAENPKVHNSKFLDNSFQNEFNTFRIEKNYHNWILFQITEMSFRTHSLFP
jgi:hypothetical protein